MSKEFFNILLKEADNEYASLVDDGIDWGDVTGYVNTGSLSLNALLSGTIFDGGFADNKIIALAGEPATGKTFYALQAVANFLLKHPDGFCFFFETEGAVTTQMFKDRGINPKRVAVLAVSTVQEFRSQATRIVDRYLQKTPEERAKMPMMFVLDSLGMLSTNKEMEDIARGEDKRDMTRAQLIKGTFRALTLKMGHAKIPMIITNHVYDVIGSYVPLKKMNGGSGLEFAASIVVFLSKKKDVHDKEVTGAIITAVLKKSRLTIENKSVETLLNYQTGLDPYYGLLDLVEKFGIFKKLSTQYELPDGKKTFEKHILADPAKYFTPDILKLIDEKCRDEFLYGKSNLTNIEGPK